MADYPIQGKLRIRPEQYERDQPFIQARVGELSRAQLKSVPGYEFLKFWYMDFAATPEQWAALAPELDQRNILVTLYEGPVFIADALMAEDKASGATKSRQRVTWMYNGVAVVLVIVALALFVTMTIDMVACVGLVGVAAVVVIVGQTHRMLRTR